GRSGGKGNRPAGQLYEGNPTDGARSKPQRLIVHKSDREVKTQVQRAKGIASKATEWSRTINPRFTKKGGTPRRLFSNSDPAFILMTISRIRKPRQTVAENGRESRSNR